MTRNVVFDFLALWRSKLTRSSAIAKRPARRSISVSDISVTSMNTETKTIAIRLRKRKRNDANLPNETNIKTTMMTSETYKKKNVSDENEN